MFVSQLGRVVCDDLFVLFQDEMIMPEVAAQPKKETAWERGLKLAKEVGFKSFKLQA